MAACTAGSATLADTANVSSYVNGTFTPAVDDLLVVLVATSGSIEPTAAGVVTDDQGGTYYKAGFATRSGAASSIYAFVRNQLALAVGHILTFACPGDAATGACILPYRVSGMTRTGINAVRQSAFTSGIAAGGTPAATFAASCLTGNPVIGVLGSAANPPAVTPPASFTEPAGFDIGVGTPAQGIEGCHIASGFTGTTVTWGSTSGGASGVVVVELDTTALIIGGRQPIRVVKQAAVQRASVW